MQEIFKKTIEQIQAESGLAGGAFALIEDGKVTLKECFGYGDVENQKPITAQTFFDIASCSKAFTTMAGALAADKGVFDWDEPAVHYMPAFRMQNPYVTAHITGRDMGSHRSGLPRHDFMRAKLHEDRADTVARIAHMSSTAGFREKFQYNNQLFVALGYMLEQITGKSWEDQVLEGIAKPLNMDMRFRGSDGGMVGLDYALPYMTNGHTIYRCEYTKGKAVAPCGGIKTNLDSLINWVMMLSQGGQFQGQRLVSERAFAELYKPNIPATWNYPPDEIQSCYGLGWGVSAYQGKLCVSHGGSNSGFNSEVGFFPNEKKGFVLLVNTNSTPAPHTLRALLIDTLLGAQKDDYRYAMARFQNTRAAIEGYQEERRTMKPLSASELDSLPGVYFHPAYDTFEISREGNQLRFAYGDFQAVLGHGKGGAIRGVPEDDVAFVELTPCDGGLKLKNIDSELQLLFQRQK